MLIAIANLALLRAIAEKLIPGIPLKSRIAILQQTERGGDDEVSEENSGGDGLGKKLDELKIKERSVLEEVIEKAISRDDIQREIDSNCLHTFIDSATNIK
jgi:hypothetical protein